MRVVVDEDDPRRDVGEKRVSRAGSSQAVSMPVSPAPTTTAVAAAGRVGAAGQIRQVPLQRHRAVVGVDVESELDADRGCRA